MAIIRFKPISHFDGTFLDRVFMSGDTVVRHRTQPDRPVVMQGVKTIREEKLIDRKIDSTLGRWALSVPKSDYWNLVARNPELNSTDGDTLDRAWRKFSASAESLPYRVTT